MQLCFPQRGGHVEQTEILRKRSSNIGTLEVIVRKLKLRLTTAKCFKFILDACKI